MNKLQHHVQSNSFFKQNYETEYSEQEAEDISLFGHLVL